MMIEAKLGLTDKMVATDPLPEAATVVMAEDCLTATLDEEAVILHTDAGQYYGFNQVGTYVWDQLEEPRSVGELCQAVTERFDVSCQRCREDVSEFVLKLEERGLVRVSEA